MKINLLQNKMLFGIKSITTVILLLCAFFAGAQDVKKVKWTEMSTNRNANFFDVQKSFNTVWKSQIKEMDR